MSGETMSLALWQGGGTSGEVARNLGEVARRAAEAAEAGAEMLVFPECFLTGYVTPDPRAVAGTIPATARAELEAISRETGLCIVLGSYEARGDRLGNAALVFDPDRGQIGSYRKTMLYGAWEKATFEPGTAPLVFSYRGWRIGVLICFDVEFPGMVRALARAGCELVVVPTALMAPHDRIAELMVPTRAMENQVFLAYANRTGREAGNRYVGKSSIRGPDGEALVGADGDGEQLLQVVLDKAALQAARRDVSYLEEEAR